MIKAVVFDIDDTLFDDLGAEHDALGCMYRSSERAADFFDLGEFISIWHDEMRLHMDRFLAGEITFHEQRIARMRGIYGKMGESLTEQQALGIFRTYLTDYERHWRLYEDAVPALDALADYPLGIVSNGDSEQQRLKLERTGITGRFSSVVISGDIGVSKPCADIFLKSAGELKTASSNILFVGDHINVDVLGAANAGLNGVWIDRYGLATAPDGIHTITDLRQLSELVRRL